MTDTPQRPPIVLIDTDTLADMDPWQELAKGKRWTEFFSHIPDAKPRDNGVRDLIDFAKSEGAFVVYTSRWDAAYRRDAWAWLEGVGFPHFDLYMRTNPYLSPAEVRLRHAVRASAKVRHTRPVVVIDADPAVCVELRAKGIAAVCADKVPDTVAGLRSLLAYARPLPTDITKKFKPKRKVSTEK
ncbi:HAD family hydrolase [Mycolicibacterium lutetiense]|uniref:Uncharacterized protein n=1 Tax=Mycolicibacterium lutetiense TaxID=1641992 RepID=A0ABS4ZSM9_9MYCO|nr:hypothetical protein [Mycolicibacterium lutetiense]MBP2452507.1 hypothetical protein [Mycolicibacterium lutetiense]